MCGRTKNFSPILRAFAFSITTLPAIFLSSAHAEDCLPKPTGQAPQGSHWYYYTDTDSGARCWFLRSAEETALAADAANQDAEDDTSADATPTARPLPLQPAKPAAPKPVARAAAHASEANESKSARSRFPTAPQAAVPSAPANEAPTKAAANIPAPAFAVLWPGDVSAAPVARTNVVAVQPTPVAPNAADDGSKRIARSEPSAQPGSPPNPIDAATRSISAGVTLAEPLSTILGLKSEHRTALLTTGLSLLTIAAGVSLATRLSQRRRRSDQRQVSRKADAPLGYREAASPRIASIHDAPPMFHEPPTKTHGVENALHKLIHELDSRRTDRQPLSDFAPKNYRMRRT